MYTFKDAIQDMLDEGEFDRMHDPKSIIPGWDEEEMGRAVAAADEYRMWIEETMDDEGNITIPQMALLTNCRSLIVLIDAICYMQLKEDLRKENSQNL